MTPPAVNVSVSDPVSADVQAVCGALRGVCDFLITPEGQATVRAWRESAAEFSAAIKQAAAWFEGLLK